MAVIGLDKPIITQIGIIVRDVERSVVRYSEILGFPAPTVSTTLRHEHSRATYYGQPTEATAKIALFEIGQIQFELIQPLTAPSCWHDFLTKQGEGVHHIGFFVPKTDVATASLARYGYRITQQGMLTGHTGMYSYLDTDSDLGVGIELVEHYGGNPHLNALSLPSEKGIGTDKVCQLGIVVHDIADTAQRYSEVLGLPTPDIIATTANPATLYNGQPCAGSAKLAFFDLGQIQLELIEPDEQPSVWRDFLDERGECPHHIAFQVAQTHAATRYLDQCRILVTQQGPYFDGSGMYTYLASEHYLGVALELLENYPRG